MRYVCTVQRNELEQPSSALTFLNGVTDGIQFCKWHCNNLLSIYLDATGDKKKHFKDKQRGTHAFQHDCNVAILSSFMRS